MDLITKTATRRYAILGTGAIGGYYGACLQRAGLDVHFLLHRDYAAVQHHGLKVDSVRGDFCLPDVQAYQQTADMPPVDVIVVSLKTTHNVHLLPHLLPPLLHPDTVILTLQNGLDIEETIAAIAPQSVILGGLCFICSNKIGPGHIHHLDYGSILMGQYDAQRRPAGQSPPLQAIAADFKRANLEITLTDDLYLARWQKLVWNVPFNSLSVILDAMTTDMMAHPDARQLAADLMAEVVTAAHACTAQATPKLTRQLPDGIIDRMLTHTADMKPYRTSMKLDFDAKRPLEIEAIVGNPLRAAQKAQVDTPRMAMLYHQLKALDAANTKRV